MLVPQDIPGVKPRTPSRRRRGTPWHPKPDALDETMRSGGREWFSDRLFVETERRHASAGSGASLTIHVAIAAAVVASVMAQPRHLAIGSTPSRLTMPVIVAPVPEGVVAPVTGSNQPRPATAPHPSPVPAPRPAFTRGLANASAPTPIAEPPALASEPAVETGLTGAVATGGQIDAVDGVLRGVVGGLGGSAAAPGPAGPAIVRAGTDIKPPRKTRDVRPIYPDGALASRGRGAVILEAVIGPDGSILEARVVSPRSVFDQAAIDAVRQWEYEPPLLNGAPVAVAMTVVVNFAVQ